MKNTFADFSLELFSANTLPDVPTADGSMVRPGKPFLSDANEWYDKLLWPDIESWDLEGSAEENNGTYLNPDALRKAFAGAEKVLLISSSEVGQRIEQHRNVIEAAKAAGVNHIAYTSAPKAATTSLIVAPEHKATEEMLFQWDMHYTILRNNWYTENYLQGIETAKKTGTIVAAAGTGRVASASRADYAAGAIAVLLGPGHCIAGGMTSSLMTTGSAQQIRDECRRLIDSVGRDGSYIMCHSTPLDDAKIENVMAMIETTREYGVYC